MQRMLAQPAVSSLSSALLLAGLLAACLPPTTAFSQSPQPSTQLESSGAKELRANITLNGQAVGAWALLDRAGVLYASQEAFESWQILRRIGAEGISHAGQTWYPLTSVPGFEASHNFATQTLRLQFTPSAVIGSPRLPQVASASSFNGLNSPAATSPALRILPLEVRINGAPGGTWPLLESGGQLHATEEAFQEWRLNRRENTQPIAYRGQAWYALSSVPGYESRLNFANQSIDLVFSPTAFSATRLSSDEVQKVALSPSIPAVFFNYDLNFNQSQFRNTGAPSKLTTRDLGALTEAGFSGNWGVLTSSFVGRNLSTNDPLVKPSWRRLETTFTRDLPEQKLTLRVGDANTRSGIGSRGVYFGGVQLTRNFALTPGFITQPIPVIQGTSSAPSTVELYVNDALRQTSKVPTGPFAIDNFPLLTGGGNVRMIVRDVLGRETVIVQPFFSHSSLLEKGLADWSMEWGAVRANLGIDQANYGQPFGSGLYRYGFSKQTTGEISAQMGRDTQTLGFGIHTALPMQILGYASLAASRDKAAGRGAEGSLGAEYTHFNHGFNGRLTGASRGYRQLGLTGNSLPPKLESAFNYSYSSERLGALGVGVARISSRTTGNINTASANYSMRIGQRSTLAFSATRAFGSGVGAPATSVSMSLNIALDKRISSSSNANYRSGQLDAFTSVNQSPASELGTGWRALAGSRAGKGYAEAGVYHQASKALATADISASSAQQSVRLGLQSALVFIDGQLHTSRRVQDSFAIVEVPGYADVGVGFQGSIQARTDASGRAFLPRLQSFQRNNIRLDPTELPISAEIDNIEQITVPAARSGVKIVFPVRFGRAALIRIVLSDGEPAPAGAEIELAGDKQEFFVARRGEAFITGMQPKNTLILKHNGTSCKMQIALPPEGKTDDILRLGPVRCEGVKR